MFADFEGEYSFDGQTLACVIYGTGRRNAFKADLKGDVLPCVIDGQETRVYSRVQ